MMVRVINMYTENFNENIIREHMKKLSVMDIADSVYFFGINFDTCSLDDIVSSVWSLYCEVETLGRMVENDFQSDDDVKVLIPKSRETRDIVAQDYYRKKGALDKALACKDLVVLVRESMKKEYEKQETSGRSKH